MSGADLRPPPIAVHTGAMEIVVWGVVAAVATMAFQGSAGLVPALIIGFGLGGFLAMTASAARG